MSPSTASASPQSSQRAGRRAGTKRCQHVEEPSGHLQGARVLHALASRRRSEKPSPVASPDSGAPTAALTDGPGDVSGWAGREKVGPPEPPPRMRPRQRMDAQLASFMTSGRATARRCHRAGRQHQFGGGEEHPLQRKPQALVHLGAGYGRSNNCLPHWWDRNDHLRDCGWHADDGKALDRHLSTLTLTGHH